MSYQPASLIGKTAERVIDSVGRVLDGEHTPPIRWVALGALAGFAVAAAGIIEAGRSEAES